MFLPTPKKYHSPEARLAAQRTQQLAYQNSEKGKDAAWRYHVEKKLGGTVEEYWRLHKEQNGLCAICKRPSRKKLAWDHKHLTGKLRGLLCFRCNSAIGNLDEDLERLKAAITYLEKYNA